MMARRLGGIAGEVVLSVNGRGGEGKYKGEASRQFGPDCRYHDDG